MIKGFVGMVPTIGAEEEFYLFELATMKPAIPGDALLEKLENELGLRFTREYKKCQVESISMPHTDIDKLCQDLFANRFIISELLKPHGLGIMSTGIHPGAHWKDMPARDDERYHWIAHRLGERIQRLNACGLHLHVGTFNDDEARIQRMSAYKTLIPLLIAAASSSPFAAGRYTGSKSWRRTVTSMLGRQTPPDFINKEQWESYLAQQIVSDHIRSECDVWSDIRPGTNGKPTVEIRACDVSPTVETAPAIAAIVQAFEYGLRTGQLTFNTENTQIALDRQDKDAMEAAKFGFDAVQAGSPQNETLRATALEFVSTIEPIASELGTTAWIERFKRIVRDGSAADHMLAIAGIEADQLTQRPIDRDAIDRVMRWAAVETLKPPTCQWPPTSTKHLLTPNKEHRHDP